MNRFLTGLLTGFALCASSLVAFETNVYIGPHFNYTRMHFDNPSHLQGYQGGVTAGIETGCNDLFADLRFEGTWNAGPITGNPCQRSDLAEYTLDLKFGRVWHACRPCIRPYIGFGWDRFENTQDPDTVHLTYRYDKLFVPLGVYLDWTLCDWQASLQLELRPDVYSRLGLIGIHLGPAWGYAFRVQLPFETCCSCLTLGVVPFFDWNRFGRVREENSAEAALIIPRLIRWSSGLRVLVGYTF